MNEAHWQRVQELFHQAAELPRSEQLEFLRQQCGDAEDLVHEVLALLDQDAQTAGFLDRDVAQVAHETLRDSDPFTSTKVLGPYRIIRSLGEGGMGVVYLAERSDIGSTVAIKLLRDAWLSPARRERFILEQRTLAVLNHASIARLYDADTTPDGTPFFVMEYVEGVSVVEYCKIHQCPLAERLRIFRAVCEAVIYAHQHAVIHRDLKPSNILVKPDGSIRLLDFGIAKHLEVLGTAVEQTMTGLRLMTPAYASPEQIRGEQLGIQTDVYSLGVILYQLLTGSLPFDLSDRTPAEAENIVAQSEIAKPSSIQLPVQHTDLVRNVAPTKSEWADLDILCLTAMHKDVRRRYASAEALLRDVNHFLNSEPLEARPDDWMYRTGKFFVRNRNPVLASISAFIVLVSLVIFFTLRVTRARNSALAEAARTQRIQGFMLNLFRGGDEQVGPAGDLRVVALLDRGVQQAQSLDSEPGIQSELYLTLGNIYSQLGKFEKADSLLRKSLEQHTILFGPDSREVAESMVALGLLRVSQAKLDEAEKLIRQALDISRRMLPPEHPAVAKATFALGKVLEGRGAYDQAILQLDEAVHLQSKRGEQPSTDLAASLSELANSHFYLGHYDQSGDLNQRALVMQRKLYGERHPLVADTLINLGAIQFQKADYVASEHFNRQALDIVQAWYGKDHPETADTMTILGQSLTYQQRFDESAALLKQSLAIEEHVYGPVHPRVAYTLNEMGNVDMRQNKFDNAEAHFARALSIYRASYNDKHYVIGIVQSNLGGVFVERKDYLRAEQFFRDALQTYSQTLPSDHTSVAISRIRLGTALLGQSRFAEAQVESLAGYEILSKKTSPTIKWLQTARKDLASEYAGLHQPELAAKYLNAASR